MLCCNTCWFQSKRCSKWPPFTAKQYINLSLKLFNVSSNTVQLISCIFLPNFAFSFLPSFLQYTYSNVRLNLNYNNKKFFLYVLRLEEWKNGKRSTWCHLKKSQIVTFFINYNHNIWKHGQNIPSLISYSFCKNLSS